MLIGKGITKKFGGLVALSNLDFELHEGEVVGIFGPNGSGKTTLFNVISGFYRPNEGTLIFKGRRIDGRKPDEIAKKGSGRQSIVLRGRSRLPADAVF
jgi:branched-chain amino acid transport system ATP-binding protein